MLNNAHVGRSAFTVTELAERWGRHPNSIRHDLVTGKVRGFKVGGHSWRIPLSAVEQAEGGWDDAERSRITYTGLEQAKRPTPPIDTAAS
jgi:hypothetical protein